MQTYNIRALLSVVLYMERSPNTSTIADPRVVKIKALYNRRPVHKRVWKRIYSLQIFLSNFFI